MGRHPKVTKEQLLKSLQRHEGDQLKAAMELGIALSTVYRSAKRYGIEIEVTQERRVTAA